MQQYQAANELHKWLSSATMQNILQADDRRRFSGLSEFLYMVGDIYMSSRKVKVSEANSVLAHMRQGLIKADVLNRP